MARATLIFLFLFYFASVWAQSSNTDSLITANKTYFTYPLKTITGLSGAFMEPRPGAYHMGVDFPAPMGTPVHAAADGYIWRLRISPYGYGRAVYIKHNNGLLTVYGHFSKFSDSLAAYLTHYQYAHQLNEVDIYPDSLLHTHIEVKQNDIIGYVGNAGQSEAPHLHFEIREAHGETYPLNPLLFSYFDMADARAPVINNIVVYDGNILTPRLVSVIPNQVVLCSHAKVWLGVSATDYDNNGHSFGIYGYALIVDGKEVFRREKKRLDFLYLGNTEAHIDYGLRQKGINAYRLHSLLMDEEHKQDATIEMQPNKSHTVIIEVYDALNNKKTMTFTLKGAPVLKAPKEYVKYNKSYTWVGKNAIITFPPHCSYVSAHPTVIENEKGITVNDDYALLQKKYTVKLYNVGLKGGQLSKSILKVGNSVNMGAYIQDTFTAPSSSMGYIQLIKDTIPPVIQLFSSVNGQLMWYMMDALSGIGKYNIWIDNKWRIGYYDAKVGIVYCNVGDLDNGKHAVKIEVSDKVNNTTTKNFTFTSGVNRE